MLGSDILTVSSTARVIAQQIIAGAGRGLRMPHWYWTMTAETLPPRLREDFGFRHGDAERKLTGRAIEWIRRLYPILPSRVRLVGPFQEADARVSGKSPVGLATKLLNRFWIGQPLLG